MKKIAFIFLILFIPNGILGGEQKDLERPDNITRIFSRITNSVAGVKTISSDFIQEKHLNMLNKVQILKGKFYYKSDDRMRWEMYEPVNAGFSVNGKNAKRWDKKSGGMQSFKVYQVPFIKKFADRVFAWAKADIKQLQKKYRIQVLSDQPVDLKLYPISSQERKHLKHLRFIFSADTSHVRVIETHESDGDITLIRFLNLRINEHLDDSLFN